MIIDSKVKISNHKCFGSQKQGFEQIMPISVMIGKNNSGKSSILDLVEYMCTVEGKFFLSNHESGEKIVTYDIILDKEMIDNNFDVRSTRNSVGNLNTFGKKYINTRLVFTQNRSAIDFISVNDEKDNKCKDIFANLAKRVERPLRGKIFIKISAERDIKPEEHLLSEVSSNGDGLTSTLHDYILHADYNTEIIEKVLLNQLNLITQPDINFKKISIQKNSNSLLEVYLSNNKGKPIPVSSMGSGVKTILLVLYNLIVYPQIRKIEESRFVFAFEELENNIHPGMLKRLLNYISKYSKKHNCYFFLTTHSSIVIDIFGRNEDSQIIHLSNNGINSIAKTVFCKNDEINILDDLGVKASDILQTNGIIWVEGMSDRVYLNKWLSLMGTKYVEGIHYSIMTYGGGTLSWFDPNLNWIDDKLIPLLKINRNAFVLMDSDRAKKESKINNTKKRISNVIGENKFWVTKGREIENYLSEEVLVRWLESKNIEDPKFKHEEFEKLENTILSLNKNCKIKYSGKKVKYSREISEYIEADDLNILDLDEQLKTIQQNIEDWNT